MYIYTMNNLGPIAQSVERRTHNPLVPGSSPGGSIPAGVAQSAEASDLKSDKYGFKSHHRYHNAY